MTWPPDQDSEFDPLSAAANQQPERDELECKADQIQMPFNEEKDRENYERKHYSLLAQRILKESIFLSVPKEAPIDKNNEVKEEENVQEKDKVLSVKKESEDPKNLKVPNHKYKSLYRKEGKTLICCNCGMDYQSERGIYYHLNNTTCGFGHKEAKLERRSLDYTNMWRKDENKYVCCTCEVTYNSDTGVRRHLKESNCGFGLGKGGKDNEGFPCPICKFTGMTESGLKMHVKKIHEQPNIKCLDCGEIFMNKKQLTEHSVQHHGGRKCADCDNRYQTRVSYDNHYRVEHLGQTKHCEVCGKEFKTNAHLKTHMNIHLGLKPHVCDQCGSAFADPSALAKHSKTQHHSEIIRVPTTCTICAKVLERY